MKSTVIIIPTRLEAKRFPNKPLAKINDVPMIIHVLNRAKESKIGEVLVATPDDEIIQVVKKNGGKAILTSGLFGNLFAPNRLGMIIAVFFISINIMRLTVAKQTYLSSFFSPKS